MADESPKGNEGKLLKLPLARIKMIMKSSPDLGSVNQEGYFLIARAAVCKIPLPATFGFKSV